MESGFIDWVVADQGLSEKYAAGLERALRGLVRDGVVLPQRGDTAERARERVRPYLAAKLRQWCPACQRVVFGGG